MKKYKKRLSKDESQRTITKRMIRAVLDGKQTNYAYDKEIQVAIIEVEREHEENFNNIFEGISLRQLLMEDTSMIENKLRDMGLRIHGDK